ARPRLPDRAPAPPGLQPLGLGADRDGFLFVPSGAASGDALPLVLMLHGAGGTGRSGLAPFLDLADEAGVILLAPDSRGHTWDAVRDGFGADVDFISRALEDVFGRSTVDPDRIAVEGFSDGASYALGLGLANGDRFGRVMAFSPGFAPRARAHGRPPVFVAHGTADDVLPIDRCSRRIVPALRDRGYDVRYVEFEGGHELPAGVAEEALAWFLGGS
ncbi:MAG: alpha/beta hydrolase-fold protein, partial [Actinomycetota bacterium]|nr:alpha/beta hydrolase-fold protein [Actinomycetota bacterium]